MSQTPPFILAQFHTSITTATTYTGAALTHVNIDAAQTHVYIEIAQTHVYTDQVHVMLDIW